MKIEDKKRLVLNFLLKARLGDHKLGDVPVSKEGWRRPTVIGVEALFTKEFNGSSKASPVCKALVEDGLVERKHPGYYRAKQ